MNRRSLLAVILGVVVTAPVAAQGVLRGNADSYLYASETIDGSQLWDFYQRLRFQAWFKQSPQVKLRTSMRVARRGDPADWEGRLYNGYLEWKPNPQVDVRAGRQFLFRGVIRGTADALNLGIKPAKEADLALRVVAGLEQPRGGDFEFGSLDEGYVLGAYGSGQLSRSAKLDLSIFQRVRSVLDAGSQESERRLVWHVAGATLTGELTLGVFYLAEFNYNLQSDTYQRMRYRLTYSADPWTVSGEFQSQKPEVFEDSFFNIFTLNAYDQFRVAGYYRFGNYQVGLQNYLTLYEESKRGNEIIATLSARWGTLGVVYQSGFGGDRIGLYGEARYELAQGVEARAHSSHYNYQRYTASFDEDATSFSAGLRYRPIPKLMLDAEVQESINSIYDNHLRGLLRVSYNFSTI